MMHHHLYKTPITMSFNPTAVACSHVDPDTEAAPFDSLVIVVHKTMKGQTRREESCRRCVRYTYLESIGEL
jgi:hypothetical protein